MSVFPSETPDENGAGNEFVSASGRVRDGVTVPDVAEVWRAEIERRLAAMDRGDTWAVPWEDARARLWAKYPGGGKLAVE